MWSYFRWLSINNFFEQSYKQGFDAKEVIFDVALVTKDNKWQKNITFLEYRNPRLSKILHAYLNYKVLNHSLKCENKSYKVLYLFN